ncbi:hypothetical protein CHU98_g10420 [Xylaria longipes]|nr:hypothetical protein CHU98_g10420 [Xylaria longipes]
MERPMVRPLTTRLDGSLTGSHSARHEATPMVKMKGMMPPQDSTCYQLPTVLSLGAADNPAPIAAQSPSLVFINRAVQQRHAHRDNNGPPVPRCSVRLKSRFDQEIERERRKTLISGAPGFATDLKKIRLAMPTHLRLYGLVQGLVRGLPKENSTGDADAPATIWTGPGQNLDTYTSDPWSLNLRVSALVLENHPIGGLLIQRLLRTWRAHHHPVPARSASSPFFQSSLELKLYQGSTYDDVQTPKKGFSTILARSRQAVRRQAQNPPAHQLTPQRWISVLRRRQLNQFRRIPLNLGTAEEKLRTIPPEFKIAPGIDR